LVEERTRDLRREKARAEAASRAKSEFLANMSHEIRTPLNAVLGMTSMLLETPLSVRQRDCVETIRHSGGALLSVINDILDVSKIEAGALEIELLPFVLSDSLEDALEIVRPKAEAKGLSLVRRIGPGVPDAIASDAARLRQILVNLLDNAVKFTERGEVSLDVELVPPAGGLAGSAGDPGDPGDPSGPGDTEDVELRFIIRDSGIGVPPERLDRLFQPFSQADSSTTRLYGGTGLGLVISRRLAEHLGGGMWVESTPGKGSAFSFTIRCQPAEAVPHAPTPSPAPLAALLPLRILLAEDNSVNQKVALLMLERLGYRADVAADGYEALAAVLRQRYDLVLMDVHMPGMDGLEATRRIRAEAPADHQPRIVALTANVLVEYRKACLEAGMNDFLSKPMLLADLRAALLRSQGKETPGSQEPPPEPSAGSPSLDLARLDSLRRLGQIAGSSVLDNIVGSFLAEAPRRLERLRQALDKSDAQDLAFLAHSLKGSSSQLGAVRLAALSADLEERSLSSELTEAAGLLDEIEQEVERVAPLLQAQR
jgi:signal transduction histidine kinase/DNA-binding response OmpR family regulator